MYSTCLVLEIQDTLHVQYVFSAGDTGYTTCTVRI